MGYEEGPLVWPRKDAIFEAEHGEYTLLGWWLDSGYLMFSFICEILFLIIFPILCIIFMIFIGTDYLSLLSLLVLVPFYILGTWKWIRYLLNVRCIIFNDGFYSGHISFIHFIQKEVPVIPWSNINNVEILGPEDRTWSRSFFLNGDFFGKNEVIRITLNNGKPIDILTHLDMQDILYHLYTRVPAKFTKKARSMKKSEPITATQDETSLESQSEQYRAQVKKELEENSEGDPFQRSIIEFNNKDFEIKYLLKTRPLREAIFVGIDGYTDNLSKWKRTSKTTRITAVVFSIIIIAICVLGIVSGSWYSVIPIVFVIFLLIAAFMVVFSLELYNETILIFPDGFSTGSRTLLHFISDHFPIIHWYKIEWVDIYRLGPNHLKTTANLKFAEEHRKDYLLIKIFGESLPRTIETKNQAREVLRILADHVPRKLTPDAWRLIGLEAIKKKKKKRPSKK